MVAAVDEIVDVARRPDRQTVNGTEDTAPVLVAAVFATRSHIMGAVGANMMKLRNFRSTLLMTRRRILSYLSVHIFGGWVLLMNRDECSGPATEAHRFLTLLHSKFITVSTFGCFESNTASDGLLIQMTSGGQFDKIEVTFSAHVMYQFA